MNQTLGVPMFSSIDNFLISRMQWVVRQIELFSSIERRTVGYTLLACNLLFGFPVLMTVSTCFFKIIFGPNKFWFDAPVQAWILIIFAVLLFVHVETYLVATKLLEKKTDFTSLPAEIITRIDVRESLFHLMAAYLFLFVMLGTIIAIFAKDTSPLAYAVLLLIMEGGLLIRITLEYLFCTTSLPPGEKERKIREREMKHLTPVRSGG